MDDVKAAIDSQSQQILDARPKARFDGQQGEPRPAPRLGHMPGARNVPFGSLVNAGRHAQIRMRSCAPFSRRRASIPASPPLRAAGRALRLACWR